MKLRGKLNLRTCPDMNPAQSIEISIRTLGIELFGKYWKMKDEHRVFPKCEYCFRHDVALIA